jgi:hypothetical protein
MLTQWRDLVPDLRFLAQLRQWEKECRAKREEKRERDREKE